MGPPEKEKELIEMFICLGFYIILFFALSKKKNVSFFTVCVALNEMDFLKIHW